MRRAISLFVAIIALASLPNVGSAESVKVGQVLVAHEGLNDANFYSSVVLIIGDGKLGTIGLVLNRSLAARPSVDLPSEYTQLLANRPLHFGGPVAIDQLRVLVSSQYTVPSAIAVADNLYFADNRTSLDYLLENQDSIENLRVFFGMASWLPGQLAAEISHGAWYVSDIEMADIFSDSEDLWQRMMTRIHAQWVHRWTTPQHAIGPLR